MWLRDSGSKIQNLVSSGPKVNGLPSFSRWHITAIGFSVFLFALRFSGTLMTGLFSTETQYIEVLDSQALITAPIWNASYNATALLSTDGARNAASAFVYLLSGSQKLNISEISPEWDSEPVNVTAFDIYNNVLTSSGTTMLRSDYFQLTASAGCQVPPDVEYDNNTSGAFRFTRENCTMAHDQYGLDLKVTYKKSDALFIELTTDSWGQVSWVSKRCPQSESSNERP